MTNETDRLEYLITTILSHKDWSYIDEFPTFSWVNRCFLNLQLKLARNLLKCYNTNDFFVANILANSMCDALLQQLWMEIDKEKRASAYKCFYLISSLPYLHEKNKASIQQEIISNPFYTVFLRPNKTTLSLDRKDYVSEWFQFNDGRSGHEKRTRYNLYDEWKKYMMKQDMDENQIVNTYEAYKHTCPFKHFSSNIVLRAFDIDKLKFVEYKIDKDTSTHIATMSLDFSLYMVNLTQKQKIKY